jgi:hypothetical protein
VARPRAKVFVCRPPFGTGDALTKFEISQCGSRPALPLPMPSCTADAPNALAEGADSPKDSLASNLAFAISVVSSDFGSSLPASRKYLLLCIDHLTFIWTQPFTMLAYKLPIALALAVTALAFSGPSDSLGAIPIDNTIEGVLSEHALRARHYGRHANHENDEVALQVRHFLHPRPHSKTDDNDPSIEARGIGRHPRLKDDDSLEARRLGRHHDLSEDSSAALDVRGIGRHPRTKDEGALDTRGIGRHHEHSEDSSAFQVSKRTLDKTLTAMFRYIWEPLDELTRAMPTTSFWRGPGVLDKLEKANVFLSRYAQLDSGRKGSSARNEDFQTALRRVRASIRSVAPHSCVPQEVEVMVIAMQKVQDSFGEIRKEGQVGKVAAALAEMAENIHASHVLSLAKG